ncbi:MAG: hypothetical protein KC616_03015, partial [Myxococcales bacterium]|nr:hypothetical protein [Myxococcales bacterium]
MVRTSRHERRGRGRDGARREARGAARVIRALAIGAACFLSFAFATMAPAAADAGVDPGSAIDVVFVLDNSGSMKTNDPQRLTRRAVADFADALAAETSLDGRIGLVLFD